MPPRVDSIILFIIFGTTRLFADRHTRSIETRAIARTDPLFGLKPTTKLRAR
ncbi:MAG: hypothetical protein K8F92_15535 [Hyphomicrobium sp.]|uniref:hypothetical protein n=1 Tax=Hyphomicrobium sp. TaxID=82 RepID=UPI0025BB3806|nr:hypothetical protein [Hyphomicrobium sp.]MBZ0211042.1 hypothetical protein [Hyphomicrobium sp.]